MKRIFLSAIILLCLVNRESLRGDVRLPSLISDNMVLQQNTELPIWGWADPNEQVSLKVSWQDAPLSAKAGNDGKWMLKVKTPKAGDTVHKIEIKAGNTIVIKNILFGEVWVCSGQSNMAWTVGHSMNADQEIATAKFPQIRFFSVGQLMADKPQDNCLGVWTECNPSSVVEFSAIAYFFGRYLHKDLGVPIGLINSSWGGTRIEAWTSQKTLQSFGRYAGELERQATMKQLIAGYKDIVADWKRQNNREDPCNTGFAKGYAAVEYDSSSWKEMILPKPMEMTPDTNIDGVVWFRKSVNIPVSWSGHDITLSLGPIDDADITYFDGVQVGSIGTDVWNCWQLPRNYTIPGHLVKAGRNVISIRVLDNFGNGGIYGAAVELKLISKNYKDEPISLAGTWQYKVEYVFGPLKSNKPDLLTPENMIYGLFNGMIAPLLPYRIKGAIWYQGESNTTNSYQYRTLFPAMIKDWRDSWAQGDFPFYYVQLASLFRHAPSENVVPEKGLPAEDSWAELREAQLMALDLPHTGMAVTIDIGAANDVHPKNKQDVGKRLALWALAKDYGRNVDYSGPIYKKMEIKAGGIRLYFDYVGKGLVAKNGRLDGFAIAGADKKFVWADAEIQGDTIVVSSREVHNPVAVRYAWAMFPFCNLYNKEGLPASPFRTDDWPGLTANVK
jgi:sialate O-acetylesterase